MKNNLRGFTLLELIIAIAIASMMTIVIFTSFYQINKSASEINTMISIDTRAVIFSNQFEKDISGAFIPNIQEAKNEKIKQETEKKVKSIETPKLEKAFYSINQEKNLKTISFITCNPLQVYGQTKPRIARVTYKLKESKENKNSFSLFRQESQQLNFESKAPEYEIVDNIKDFNIEFFVLEESKDEASRLKKINEWREKDLQSRVPKSVKVKMTLWNNERQLKEQKFEFKYIIYTYNLYKEKPKPEKAKEEDKKGKEDKEKKEKEKGGKEKENKK